ncbi:hypothetical protein BsWGS_03059 [Bradybaena similaris]
MDTDKERKLQVVSHAAEVIAAIAHVNTSLPDDRCSPAATSFLPVLRTSPCQIYHRKHQKQHPTLHQQQQIQRPDGRNELVQSTSCHGRRGTSRSAVALLSWNSRLQEEAKFQADRNLVTQKDMKTDKPKISSLSGLPTETIEPQDFVNSWLKYGSQVDGSHFPDILPTTRHVSHTVLCKSGKKQTLSPIETHKTRKFCSKTSAFSDLQ